MKEIKFEFDNGNFVSVEKDVFGRWIVAAEDKDRHKRYETRKILSGEYKLMDVAPYWCVNANVDYGYGFWFDIEPFPNLSQAFKFLKENLDRLL